MNTTTRALLAVAASTALITTATLTTGYAAAAPATRPTPLIAGYPKCVTTAAGARAHGWALTPRGQVCAAKMVGTRVTATRTDYTRTQPRTESWELLALITDPDTGAIVANLVRRPR